MNFQKLLEKLKYYASHSLFLLGLGIWLLLATAVYLDLGYVLGLISGALIGASAMNIYKSFTKNIKSL